MKSQGNLRLANYKTFELSLAEIQPLFDGIKADHCMIFYNHRKYAATGKTITKSDYSEQWKKKFDSKPTFEARMLTPKYGYILMPAISTFDNSPENIQKLAQPMYDRIAELKRSHNAEGWILDLRFNTGGNLAPMLLALYDLLSDHAVWTTIDGSLKKTFAIKLEKGQYLDGVKKPSSIRSEGALMDEAKVAVLTSPFTASSGEVTALAFKGRPQNVFRRDSHLWCHEFQHQPRLAFRNNNGDNHRL